MPLLPSRFASECRDEESISKYLLGHRVFGTLPETVISDLALVVTRRVYNKGHQVYYAGDAPTYVFLVRSGLFVMTQADPFGKTHATMVYYPGDVFGLGSTVRGYRFAWTANAVVDTEILLIDRDTFDNLFRTYPDLAYRVATELSFLLIRSQQTTVRLAVTPVASRIACLLLDLAAETSQPDADPVSIDFPLSHQDLALLLGTSRETVTRVMARFCRSRLIALSGRRILLLNRRALCQMAE